MSEPQASHTTALLARKGLAAPVGAASDAALAPAPDSLPEVDAPAQAGKGPAASLQPLDFLAGRPPGLRGARDLAQHLPDPPQVAVVPAVGPEAEPKPKPAPTGTEVPKLSAKSEIPHPDPGLRPTLRIDAGAKPAVRKESQRLPALAAGLALAFVLGAAGYGYQSGWFVSLPPERSQAPSAAAVAPAESPLPAAPSVSETNRPAKAGQSTEADQPSIDVVRIEPDGAAVIAGQAAPGAELILLDNGAPIGTVVADAYGEWVFIPSSPLPSGAHDFGLVIKEVRGGVSVPAGGQAPAKRDAATPGVSGINEPGTAVGAAATVPIPPRKPNTGTKHATGVPSPAFMVQLASVKSRTGAQREWRALRERFPEILSQMSLSLDEAKLAGGATVVRLRTGAFPKRAEAAALCARLTAKHQDCLVVRTAVKR